MSNLYEFTCSIVDHCNLNCRSCSSYAPLASPWFMDEKDFEYDYAKLASLNAVVKQITLYGGEPLIHPNWHEFARITRRLFPDTRIQIVTNGVLLLQDFENIWNKLEWYDIHLSVSYTTENLVSSIKKLLSSKCGANIRWSIQPPKTFNLSPVDLLGQSDPNHYHTCSLDGCGTELSRGKLWACFMPAHVHHFNKYFNKDIEVTDKDFLDIHEVSSYDEIINFIKRTEPYPFCRWCKIGTPGLPGSPWSLSQKLIEEWTIEEK